MPKGFCWESNNCADEPIVLNRDLKTYNADERTSEFHDWVLHQKSHYKSNHLFVLMGEDFYY